jgi:hypothetical protein
MMLQALAPRVEDHQPADGGAEPSRIRRDLQQGGGAGLEEEVVDDALVHERQPCEDLRHREHDVYIADGQEFLLARRDPRVAGRGEALGTMPIPTGNGELSITCLMESPRFWGVPSLSPALRSAFVAHSSP